MFVKRCPWYSCHYRNGEIKLQNIRDKKDNPKEKAPWLKVSDTAIFDARRNALLWVSKQILHCKWSYFQAYVYSVSLPNACYNKCTITCEKCNCLETNIDWFWIVLYIIKPLLASSALYILFNISKCHYRNVSLAKQIPWIYQIVSVMTSVLR